MHELSVTESILKICITHAQQAGALRVNTINLVIGRLSSIVDDSVQFYWDIISEGTVCDGAKLAFTRLPAQLVCLDCGKEYSFDTDMIPCPVCQGIHTRVVSGDQFYVDSIEIEPIEAKS